MEGFILSSLSLLWGNLVSSLLVWAWCKKVHERSELVPFEINGRTSMNFSGCEIGTQKRFVLKLGFKKFIFTLLTRLVSLMTVRNILYIQHL